MMRSGQAMLLTVIALGGTLLGATTIAGLLMLHQIRQSTDLKDSTKAIFAANAGLEMAGYMLRFDDYPVPTTSSSLIDTEGGSNGGSIEKIVCYSDYLNPDPSNEIPCVKSAGSPTVRLVRSYGVSGRANRALEQ